MFKKGEYLVYKREVCQVEEIKEKYRNNVDYYLLIPIDDKSLKIQIPVESPLIRNLLTKEEIIKIINEIPDIGIIECNDKIIENEYKKLLYSESHQDLIKIIKTTYLRNKQRIDNNKKIGEKDKYYFDKAEKLLYNEFSFGLNMSVEEVREYIKQNIGIK